MAERRQGAGLIAGWELLATDDEGPGAEPGTRRMRISTVAHMPNGDMRFVQARCDLSPQQLDTWIATVSGRQVEP